MPFKCMRYIYVRSTELLQSTLLIFTTIRHTDPLHQPLRHPRRNRARTNGHPFERHSFPVLRFCKLHNSLHVSLLVDHHRVRYCKFLDWWEHVWSYLFLGVKEGSGYTRRSRPSVVSSSNEPIDPKSP